MCSVFIILAAMVTAQHPGWQGAFLLYRHAKQPGTWEWEEGLMRAGVGLTL